MRLRAAAAAVLLVAATGAVAGTDAVPAGARAPGAQLRFHITDPRITEASGIAVGIRSRAVYVQNDSGDSARFFALDPRSGATLATYAVDGARNVDWEDISVARDTHGTPSVWLADIGDNDSSRASVQLYRVDEPRVPAAGAPAAVDVGPADVWNLRYPDGAHDAETLIVDDHGRAFVVTKSMIGASGVYEVPAHPGAAVQTMRRVGSVHFAPTSTPGPFGIVGHLTATGGSFGDGAVVIRTYTDAYVWASTGGVVAALKGTPTRIPLPEQRQGEGVCLANGELLVDSEGRDSPVYALPLIVRRVDSSPGSAVPQEPSTSQPVVIRHSGRSTGSIVVLVIVAAGVAFFAIGFAGAGLIVWIRRRRRM